MTDKSHFEQKGEHMKILRALLTTGVLMALAIGCSTTQERENMLSAAGFKMVPADTPGKKAHLNSLPADKITPVQREGTVYYTFPDPKNNVLYVGEEQQYQQYRQLGLQKQIADERLNAAQLNNDAAWGFWGSWGGAVGLGDSNPPTLQPTGSPTGNPQGTESPEREK
jgi:hypothetical protein